jgi:hypothetical protein
MPSSAGRCVCRWASVGFFFDDAQWKGETKINDASRELSLAEKIALRAAGYVAEQVFECDGDAKASRCDHANIILLLEKHGLSGDDRSVRAEGEAIAREHLKAHHDEVVALAEHLAEHGHLDDATAFLNSLG